MKLVLITKILEYIQVSSADHAEKFIFDMLSRVFMPSWQQGHSLNLLKNLTNLTPVNESKGINA
jgi:hypothetical protein